MNRRLWMLGLAAAAAKSSWGHGPVEMESFYSDPEHVLALDGGAKRYTVSVGTDIKPVEDVIADVEFSIAEFNYRLTGQNNVGYAIADRDPQAPRRVARVFHFCNIEIAKQLLAAGDEYLLHTPCRLVVWQSEQQIFVASRLLPHGGRADEALVLKINNMMREIADFAVSV